MTVLIRGKVKLRIPAIQGFISTNSGKFKVGIPTKRVIDTDGPSHSLLTLDSGEYLGRVLESNWSFAQRIANGEQVDEPRRK